MEKFVRDVTFYSDQEHFKHYVCFLAQAGRFGEEIKKNGCEVYCLNMKNGLSVFSALQLLKVIREVGPDIINNHQRNILANIIIMMFRKIQKIYFEHGGHLMGHSSFATKLFYDLFAIHYQVVMTNSKHVRDRIKKFKRMENKDVLSFYCGIHLDLYERKMAKLNIKEELGIPQENKVIGIVGRLVEQKGMDDFLRVASEVNKLNKACSFVVVGDGPLRQSLEQLASQLNLKILFLGDRSDVPQFMGVFDIFIITSKWEPFGIVVLEAMAARVPVVGFSVEGMKEIFETGGGILIQKRNHRELAEVIVEVLNNDVKREQLIKEGYELVKNKFDFKNRIKCLEEIYRQLSVQKYENSAR